MIIKIPFISKRKKERRKKKEEKIRKLMNSYKYLIINNNLAGGSNKWHLDLENFFELFRVNSYDLLIRFLENSCNTEKIIIFITSFINTDITIDKFLQLHLKYNFKLILPIHEWYWYSSNNKQYHNIYLENKMKLSESTKKLFDICYKILCPTKFVYEIVYKTYPNEKLIHTDWLDYDLSNLKYNLKINKHDKINIGVLIGLSEYKGKEHVEYLVQNNIHPDVNFYIVNKNIKSYNDNYKSFIKIVKDYNIHGLLYLNKWAETWCYALSKGLASGLPILYNNIGAFKERIPKNDNKYIINNNDESEYYDFKMLTNNFNKFIQYIRNNDIFINECDPQICENSKFIDVIISSNNLIKVDRKILFIITSKILVSKNKLSYTDNRSIYSIKERFNDTLDTINSIKQNVINPIIILVDNSELNNEMKELLHQNVNHFIDRDIINSIKNIDYFTDEFLCKGTGEMFQLEIALNYIKKNISDINEYQIFKITGRYKIKKIDFDDFLNDKFVFKRNNMLYINDNILYYYTCFYKFPGLFLDLMIDITKNFTDVQKGQSYILENNYRGLEVALPNLIKEKISEKNFFKEIKYLGIEQKISVTNNYKLFCTTKFI